MKRKVLFSWSGGKDSSLALYELNKNNDFDIVLLTTVTKDYGRTSMHGVREILLERQAQSLGYPLEKVYLAKNTSNEEYESLMAQTLGKYIIQGVEAVVFGDIFLEDLKKYRENNLAKAGLKGIFPLWGRTSGEIAGTFIDLGFKTIITCVDSKVLDKRFAGRLYDREFLAELPANIDPCGENGEFHSFAFDGPIFKEKIEFATGDIVLRDNRFYFCDLIPK